MNDRYRPQSGLSRTSTKSNVTYHKYLRRYKKLKHELASDQQGGVFDNIRKKPGPGHFVQYESKMLPPYYNFPIPNREQNFDPSGSPTSLPVKEFRIAHQPYLSDPKTRDHIISILESISRNAYIVCVGYCTCTNSKSCKTPGTKFNKFTDFQIGISGKMKEGEIPAQAVLREVCEETNLRVYSRNIQNMTKFNLEDHTWHIGSVQLDKIEYCNQTKFPKIKDSENEHILILPYIQVTGQMANKGPQYNAIQSDDEKNICQVMFLQRDQVLDYVSKYDLCYMQPDYDSCTQNRCWWDNRSRKCLKSKPRQA